MTEASGSQQSALTAGESSLSVDDRQRLRAELYQLLLDLEATDSNVPRDPPKVPTSGRAPDVVYYSQRAGQLSPTALRLGLVHWAERSSKPSSDSLHELLFLLETRERASRKHGRGGHPARMRNVPVADGLAAEVEEKAGGEPLGGLVERLLRDWLAQRRLEDYLHASDEEDAPLTEDEVEEGRRAWRGEE
ncbi:hypothetical protein [Actinomadura rubrisoli]|uniref:Uncharacterized protein n=1 Tax=Actinomadura rubrisoli TaxID=2530368 RepID=A0A4R5CDU3_9ACTN|nr:hypothetical protein [Actinomadura rubrisoli]TDD97705.1 hypothetical protein E1298_01325 [Actinomadura rubrisoli]